MSSISGIGGWSTDILQSLQQSWQVNASDSTQELQKSSSSDEQNPLWNDVTETATAAGLTTEEVDELQTAIKDAIATAMESVDESEGPDAAHEAVDSAILETLQSYGLDTTDIESRMEEAKSRMQNQQAGGAPPNGGPPPGGPPPEGAGGAQGGQSSGSTLMSLLESSEDDSTASLLSSLFPLVDEEA